MLFRTFAASFAVLIIIILFMMAFSDLFYPYIDSTYCKYKRYKRDRFLKRFPAIAKRINENFK